MRALFTVQPSIGHLHPLVPVATALAAAGHDVAVCTSASFKSDVAAFNLAHIDAGLDWLTEDRSTWTTFPPMPPPGPEFARFVVTVFADVTTARMVPDLLDIAEAWKPDLIVREAMEYGGCIVAERIGIPHASIAGNGYSAVDFPGVHYFTGNRRMVAEPMERHRAQAGLAPDPDVLMPYRYLHLCFTPPSWDAPDLPRPARAEFLQHTSTVRPGATLPDWVVELDPDRPTVYSSLGTVFNKTPGILEAIIEGLRGEPINLVVTTGSDQDPARFGPQPDNIRVIQYLAQPLMLPRCDAFVTHGGFNSIKESLAAGVPMIVVPITADQPYNAQRAAASGAGRVVDPANRTPEEITAAVREVLADLSYRDSARRLRTEMAALPGPDHMVQLLESLTRQRATTSA